jgi:UDP-N-acetylglucosamine 2-epimerase (non-hydrolysing)
MKKILFIFGTRPETIKLAPLIKAFRNDKNFKVKVCVTAQHRQMLDQILDVFEIKPDYDLNVMTENQTLSILNASILNELEAVFNKEKPDHVFVQGDTTSTYVGALAGFYQRCKVCHIEAGLRTGEKYAPYPEELNRRLTSVLADYHFPPTAEAKKNLLREGVAKKNIFQVGNTVIDALLAMAELVKNDEPQKYANFTKIDFSKKIILVTGHRRENFGEGFQNICLALKELAEKNKDVEIVYPVHLNPNVKKPVYEILGSVKNIKLLEPLGYKEFVYLLSKAYFVITDSGGVQEEAPSLGKPVLVLRKVTERPEAVKAGTVKLVGTDKARIVRYAQELLCGGRLYKKMARAHNPYGDGQSTQRILKVMRNLP